MTRMKISTIAALITSAIATPVLAQDMERPAMVKHQRHHAVTNDRNSDANASYQERDTGFWPADAAAGIVGGAVGAAGAIASAPFRNGYDDSYAYDDSPRYGTVRGYGYNDGYAPQSYAQRNGFTCQPGTMTRMEDGRMHLCQ
jgi:hypothetical protein